MNTEIIVALLAFLAKGVITQAEYEWIVGV